MLTMAILKHLQTLIQGVTAWNNWRSEFPLIKPDLSGASLRAFMLREANLSGANLSGADLRDVNFRRANLNIARLDNTKLYRSYICGAQLIGTSFKGAVLYETVFADVNLSSAKYLEYCLHKGPSILDHRTLTRSVGMPIEFLRGCGLPDFMVNGATDMGSDKNQYSSCFISYSSQDQSFAERLYEDLQNNGVRCWFAQEDFKIGEKIRTGIDESIRKHDRLLLILSEHSISSRWVEQEVETALAREREEEKLVLFPIRLDDAVMTIKSSWPSLIKNTMYIGDFRRWEEADSYKRALARLLRDLRADDSS